MTPDLDLEALREVVDAQAGLPWRIRCDNWDEVLDERSERVAGLLVHADAALIVAAVNALPVLLDEVQRLRDELERAYTFGTDSGL